MHILVTGGTGFIGKVLCRKLIENDCQVTVYSRQPDQVKKLTHPQCRGINQLTPDQFNQPVDAIINLAGEPIAQSRWSQQRKEVLISSRIDTTKKLVDLCSKLTPKPKVLISASAVGYYGAQEDNEVTENTVPNQEFTHQLCYRWEQAAIAAEPLGIRVAIARIGLVVGQQGGFLSKMLTPFKLGLGGKLGSGKQWMPWIHISDLTNILLYLLEHQHCHGIYNATAPQPVTNNEFTRQLGNILHRPTLLSVPEFVLKGTMGEMATLLLTGQKAVPHRLVSEESYHFQYSTLEEALREVL